MAKQEGRNHSKKTAKTRALFVLNKKQNKSEQHRENTEHRDDAVTIIPNRTQTQQGQARTNKQFDRTAKTKAETTAKKTEKTSHYLCYIQRRVKQVQTT